MRASFVLGLLWVLAIAVSVAAPAQQNRLQIELLPIAVHSIDESDDITGDVLESTAPDSDSIARALASVHMALDMLGVLPDEYDLQLSTDASPVMLCKRPQVYSGPSVACSIESVGGGRILQRQDVHDLMILLGYDRANHAFQGTVVIGILILPDGFHWAGTLYGVNKWWSWNGWHPDDLHWETTSCSIWSAPWVKGIAHELGHCFGLRHTTEDPYQNDNDWRFDLMTSVNEGGNLSVSWLKPWNAARVRHHFRNRNADETTQTHPAFGQTVN